MVSRNLMLKWFIRICSELEKKNEKYCLTGNYIFNSFNFVFLKQYLCFKYSSYRKEINSQREITFNLISHTILIHKHYNWQLIHI